MPRAEQGSARVRSPCLLASVPCSGLRLVASLAEMDGSKDGLRPIEIDPRGLGRVKGAPLPFQHKPT